MKLTFLPQNTRFRYYYCRSYIISLRPSTILFWFSVINLIAIVFFSNNKELIRNWTHLFFPSIHNSDFITESLKVLGAAIYAGFVAILVTNIWQQKSLGFEMLKELNSPEFYEVRRILSIQKSISLKEKIDLENINSWFTEKNREIKGVKIVSSKFFSQNHALSNTLYYLVRLSNYGRSGMLNLDLAQNLFNNFFVHYHIEFLEFARAYEIYVDNNKVENEKACRRRIEDIRFFFYFIDLSHELPKGHTYKYFPSLNDIPTNMKYAANYDIDKYDNDFHNKLISLKEQLKKLITP